MKKTTGILAAVTVVAMCGLSSAAQATSGYGHGYFRHYGNPHGFYGGEASKRYMPFYLRQYDYRSFFGPYYYRLDDPRYYGASRRTGVSRRIDQSRCSKWRGRCAQNWGRGGYNYRGCLRYHGCR